MVVELTPKKAHVRVATASQKKPLTIDLEKIREPPAQPLEGLGFVISGNIFERGDKKKLNTEQLAALILKNGGVVYTGEVEKAVDADFILITSQKEVDKDYLKINKAIALAYRLGWPIVSKQFVLEADGKQEPLDINNYKLNLSKIKQCPQNALGKVLVIKRNTVVHNSRKHSAHQEMKKIIRQIHSRKRSEESQKEALAKHPPKRPCTGFITYSIEQFPEVCKVHPRQPFKEISRLIANKWKTLDNETKAEYVKQGKENHRKRLERWKSRAM